MERLHLDLVQQGISEKVPLVANFAGAFFCSFILAFIRSCRLALALSTILPAIIIGGALMNKFVVMYKQYVVVLLYRFPSSSQNILEIHSRGW